MHPGRNAASGSGPEGLLRRGLRRLRRELLHPFRVLGIPLNRNDRRLVALRNSHRGRRAFIIGNGPSLRASDLDRLTAEVTFASNKIYLAFSETAWRPTYYSVCDGLVASQCHAAINELPLTMLLSDNVRDHLSPRGNATWFRETPVIQQPSSPHHPFSDNLLAGAYWGGSVTYLQLQMAYYMGITEVVLIGMDLSFQIPSKRMLTGIRHHETALQCEGERNHFHPDYRKPGEPWTFPDLDSHVIAFQSGEAFYRSRGRRVVNASRTTRLEGIPRIKFDDLF